MKFVLIVLFFNSISHDNVRMKTDHHGAGFSIEFNTLERCQKVGEIIRGKYEYGTVMTICEVKD
jgi:hypothetical protein